MIGSFQTILRIVNESRDCFLLSRVLVECFITKKGELTDKKLMILFFTALYVNQKTTAKDKNSHNIKLKVRAMQEISGIDRKTMRKWKNVFEEEKIKTPHNRTRTFSYVSYPRTKTVLAHPGYSMKRFLRSFAFAITALWVFSLLRVLVANFFIPLALPFSHVL
jgi:hypothetical protein